MTVPLPAGIRRRLRLDAFWRLGLWLFWIGYFIFAVLFLSLRYAVLPNIQAYRGDLERALSTSLGQPVAISRIDADWQGLRPRLGLHGVAIKDAQGRTALTLDNVEAVLSWTSLYWLEPRLHRLEVVAPSLLVRRDPAGRLFVAGLEVKAATPGTALSDWVLAQDQIVVRDAAITWQDDQRPAPPLTLAHVNFELDNLFSHHRFGLTAEPPAQMATRLDLRGDFHGRHLDRLDTWKGQAYAELDYADLAVWRQWVDYPVALSRGRGAVRVWADLADGRVASTTADVAVADLLLRLGRDLPELDLERLSGRLSGRRTNAGFEVAAKGLTLATRDGLRVVPTDFDLAWTAAGPQTPPRGQFTASALDLDTVVRLAAYLPFDAALRAQLAAYDPHGRLPELKLAWSGLPGQPGGVAAYSVTARFENLGLKAQGQIPGFSGLSGRIDGDEKGGSITLASRNAGVDLPTVFADSYVPLASLDATATWKRDGVAYEIDIGKTTFRNDDARGEVRGLYRGRIGTAGTIDLTARLTDADARSVWRYMPLVTGAQVRDWLHQSLLGGVAEEATLRLRGDLARFPFADGSGVFEVKGRFHDGRLRYAPDWPEISGVQGTLLFEGQRMRIDASAGRVFGTSLSGVRCDISDLGAREPLLTVSGHAGGATGDFLHFIEASPVGAHIDHVTQDMSAQGMGSLDLKLALPLAHLERTGIEGVYQFANNRIIVMPGLPTLTEATGRLSFSGDRLFLPHARANFLGAPVTVDVRTGADGAVRAVAEGRMDVATLRRQYDSPLFDHLSGDSSWRVTVGMKTSVPEVKVESNLVGLASSLPPPLNKSARDALPLVIERKAATEAGRDLITLSLGRDVNAVLLRRKEGKDMAVDRGIVGIGDSAPMPDRGVLLAARFDKVDLGFWRQVLGGGAEQGAPSPVNALRVKAATATAFGYQLNDLNLSATRGADAWTAQVASREVTGSLNWRGQGAGRLQARLRHLAVVSSAGGGNGPATDSVSQELNELPGLDIEAEDFVLRGKDLGRLKVNADNHEGRWDAKVDIDSADGSLSGTGSWKRAAGIADTRLSFKLAAKHLDGMFGRLGYPDMVRRGSGNLEGDVSWAGSPVAIDYPSLSGHLRFSAKGGQFEKLEPGAGRLLGILSLQALPRRLTLDFRDIFSEGFAFDAIDGTADLARGVAETGDLLILGPAAKILMTGKVNLAQETADLRVHVQPALGESAAVAAMLANPAAGAVAWLAQKILKDPLGKVFAYQYAVTGPWADPKVEKVSAPVAKDGGVPAGK